VFVGGPPLEAPKRLTDASRGWRHPLQLNTKELSAVSSFPPGLTNELPVKRIASRLLPPTSAIPRSGLVIGQATFPGRERSLAISADDARRHLAVLGPTGTGKSTLLSHLATAQIASGGAIVVIEPRGDLITDILAQVPANRIDDVVVINPTDRDRLVGLNPLASSGRSPELVADQLLGLFHSLYAENWGIRTQDILGAALLTLARTRDMTLACLVPLLTDHGFRRRIVGKLPDDPLGLSSFWRTFESWSEGQKLNAIAPVMSKLRPILLRPDIRAILGQSRPGFELRQVFTQKKILLVNLAAGQVGPEASALLGSLVIGQLWQAIQERSATPRERRHPVMVVLDEFQSYTHLPVDLGEALVQARGLGAPFVLAWQFLHQLNPSMRSAVLNLQSKIAFRLEHEDARVMAAGTPLSADDFQGLSAYEAYAQLVAQHTVQPWCSLATLPPQKPISDVEIVRQASRQNYGCERKEIEAELTALFAGPARDRHDDLKPRRQNPGGTNA
jgi:energy-coupling factor transporter ATP-binding protein EcfA2